MSATGRTYVIFDADEDGHHYLLMKAWKKNDRVEFDFLDAHNLTVMTSRAADETYVKGMLRERMEQSDQVLVLVGEHTQHLYKYVKWEIELAQELDLPIIVVNVNKQRDLDTDRCPAVLRNAHAIHIGYYRDMITYALAHWPAQHRQRAANRGAHHYNATIYQQFGL